MMLILAAGIPGSSLHSMGKPEPRRNMKGVFRTLVPAALFAFLWNASSSFPQGAENAGEMVIARLKYGGGGDWYNDPSAIPNLSRYMRMNTGVPVAVREEHVSLMDETLFSCPVLFMTGHGRIECTEEEINRLRDYLIHGGFLYADDDYGMDGYFRGIMKRVFPDRPLVELPFSHPVYHCRFSFPDGLPKIHEHDNKPPQGFAILDDPGRIMVFYTYETNLSDGWADPDVHGDPEEVRERALQMGTNIFIWSLIEQETQ